MRRQDLTYNEKSFLLWCWVCRETDERCDLIMCHGNCKLSNRSIQWYADYFGIPKQTMHAVFTKLRNKNIIKTTDSGKVEEITYVDFSIFS
jgi:hypothetical protein